MNNSVNAAFFIFYLISYSFEKSSIMIKYLLLYSLKQILTIAKGKAEWRPLFHDGLEITVYILLITLLKLPHEPIRYIIADVKFMTVKNVKTY